MAKKILFVDDSMAMKQMVGLALKSADYDVIIASDGQEGIDELNQRFDAIVTDLNMPKVNGIEFAKVIKQNDNNKFTPIIMMTNVSDSESKKEAQKAGIKLWMMKPFQPNQLLIVLKKLLG